MQKKIYNQSYDKNRVRKKAKNDVYPLLLTMAGSAGHENFSVIFQNQIVYDVTVQGYVLTLPDSFRTGTKTIVDWASVHRQERWFRRDFWDGAKLHRDDIL